MYPEARYSPCGTLAYLPDSLGKLVKLNKVPVVVTVHHGNHVHSPFYNFRQKRKVPLHTTMTQILTAEQVNSMSVEEVNQAIKEAMAYDDYKYVKDNGILVKEKYRAEGLHKVLYQCPNCMTESEMDSSGTVLFCKACGKKWHMNEDCTLTAQDGETEFNHIPDWFSWERAQVEKQIENGEYFFEDEVDVYSLPRCWKFEKLGKAKLTHSIEKGFILEGFYNEKEYCIQRTPAETNSLHIEYDYCYIKPYDCVDISTENDSFYCYPMNKKNVVTKLAFATEIIYQNAIKKSESK